MVTDSTQSETARIRARDVNVFYGDKQAIDRVSIDIPAEYVTAFIGPSGCGKSTFLRTLNRMNDTIPSARVEGTIELDGEDIYGSTMDVVQLRARVGMVFQKPNPFPKSIYENIAYGPRIHGLAEGKAARPDRHRPHRGTDRRAARWLCNRHRYALDAAGSARIAADRLLPPWQDGRIW